MRSKLKKALEWSADKLSGIAADIGRQNKAVEARSKFVDLAPTDQADKSGVYSDALEYALSRHPMDRARAASYRLSLRRLTEGHSTYRWRPSSPRPVPKSRR